MPARVAPQLDSPQPGGGKAGWTGVWHTGGRRLGNGGGAAGGGRLRFGGLGGGANARATARRAGWGAADGRPAARSELPAGREPPSASASAGGPRNRALPRALCKRFHWSYASLEASVPGINFSRCLRQLP